MSLGEIVVLTRFSDTSITGKAAAIVTAEGDTIQTVTIFPADGPPMWGQKVGEFDPNDPSHSLSAYYVGEPNFDGFDDDPEMHMLRIRYGNQVRAAGSVEEADRLKAEYVQKRDELLSKRPRVEGGENA